jgi:hypothetical protein
MPPLRDAGPDDPIYSSGLTLSSFRRLKLDETEPASSTSSDATPAAGEDSQKESDDCE